MKKIQVLVLALSVFALSACNDNGDGSFLSRLMGFPGSSTQIGASSEPFQNPSTGSPNKPEPFEKDCLTKWNAFWQSYRAGDLFTWAHNNNGQITTHTDETKVANYDSVESYSVHIDRIEFMQNCQSHGYLPGSETPMGNMGSGKETITVKAGSFDTTWYHDIEWVNQTERETKVHFTTLRGRNIVVQAVRKTTYKEGEVFKTNHYQEELIEFKPQP